jgi:hypothetical protein
MLSSDWARLIIPLILLGLIGAVFMAWLTPHGVGIYVDSLSYISSARNLLTGIGMGRVTGLGVFKPMTHYPPFYSLVLAFLDLCGLPSLDAARWISIAAFTGTIILVGIIVYQRTRSKFFSLLSALLVLSSNVVLRIYSWAMTEALYMMLLLLTLVFLARYLGTPARRWLILTAVTASLALLTRYVGFALLGAISLALLANCCHGWRRRLGDLGLFVSISVLPTLVWLIRNWLSSETLANRIVTWHPVSTENLQFLMKSLLSWGLIPQRLIIGRETLVFGTLAGGLAVAGVVWLWRAWPGSGKSIQPEFILLWSCWLYVGLLGVSLFWIDATTRLENRILLPLYLQILVLIMIGSTIIWQRKQWLPRLVAAAMCLWLFYFSISRLDGAIIDLRADGQGYASQKWQTSQTAAYLREHETSLIYTNDLTAVYFLANKLSVAIPNAWASEEDIELMRSNLASPHSTLVIFGQLTGEFAPLDQLTQGLTTAAQLMDGTVYILAP